MSSSDEFEVPPPWGQVGNYSDLPDYELASTLSLKWTGISGNDTELWLLKDGNTLTCLELNRGSTGCAKMLGN